MGYLIDTVVSFIVGCIAGAVGYRMIGSKIVTDIEATAARLLSKVSKP